MYLRCIYGGKAREVKESFSGDSWRSLSWNGAFLAATLSHPMGHVFSALIGLFPFVDKGAGRSLCTKHVPDRRGAASEGLFGPAIRHTPFGIRHPALGNVLAGLDLVAP
jgi:hypothetical protein